MTTMTLPDIGTTVAEVLALVEELVDLQLRGEHVDQRHHALTTAGLALDAGADDDLVAAALLHDIGRMPFLARMAPGVPHEDIGSRFVADRFGERAGWLVANHVLAKRWLVTVEAGYRDRLSAASRTSLRRQGGPLSDEVARRFAGHLWHADAIKLRRWDDDAKDPESEVPHVSVFGPSLGRAWRRRD